MLGIVLGLVILASIFALPFGNGSTTLYGSVFPLISNISGVQSQGTAQATYDYILIIAFILLVIAGVVGLFPLGTGVLGVVGMAMITVAPYLVNPGSTLGTGVGFYVIWIASIASLGASFWHGKKKQMTSPVNVTVTQTQTVGPSATQAQTQVKCPNCGAMNPAGARLCSRCGKDLPTM